ncbi:MAG TPA: metallophosphoesterase [candidate division Zixibacteria bacterium]|nr:metallophosphoesterase [candidate division Zixibacteria bacterium]
MTPPEPNTVILHSSDIHLGVDDSFDPGRGLRSLKLLKGVLAAGEAVSADIVVLAGDTFDNHRQPADLLHRAADIMRDYGRPIIVLPGNHDPLTPDSVYRRAGLATIPNVMILGLNVDNTVTFEALDLEIWGRPHMDYLDMSPLADPRPRRARWHLATAHGHYVDEPEEPGRLLGSWLIRHEDLVATGADYVALGHWNRAARVGNGEVVAHYSGSPEYEGTVNVVRLCPDRGVEVGRLPVR